MKHQAKHFKLNRDTKHRKALRYNLVRSVILHGRIKTTEAKAKCAKPILEKLITKARNKDLATTRYLLSFFRNDMVTVKKIFDISDKFATRNGGYAKIVKAGQRKGDSAKVAYLLFAGKDVL